MEDQEFLELFTKAIAVELANMAQLREHAKAFPIEDIGVAQGNSLSPLLGNLFLYDFDQEFNKRPAVRCIRYIDDFIILAPSIEKFVRTPYSFEGIKKGKDEGMSAVPAAIQAVLDAIGDGCKYVIRSDIAKFFTCIPKRK